MDILIEFDREAIDIILEGGSSFVSGAASPFEFWLDLRSGV